LKNCAANRKELMTNRQKIVLEFEVKSSPTILYTYLTTPSGLSEWYADNVNVKGKIFTFYWDGDERASEMTSKAGSKVTYKWLDCNEEEFLSLEINEDEITGDIALVVTDFVNSDELDEAIMLWESQISLLRTALGAA
jgi:uncharacterized protein YndB with AHSA1/START domain